MTWLSGNPPQSRVEIRRTARPCPGADARPPPCQTAGAAAATRAARAAAKGGGDDLRGTGLRGARGLRGAGLRDRRRAGRARHRARRSPAAAGGCSLLESGGRAPRRRGAGAVAGREPRSRDPPCAGDHRRPAARRRLEPLGRALPAVRPGRLRAPGPGLGRPAGLADRAGRARALARRRPAPGSPPATRCSPSRCPGSRPTPAFGFESLERWSNRPRIQELHGAELAARPEPPRRARGDGDRLRGRATAGGSRRRAAHVEGRGRGRVAAPIVVLAAGGNESTRLLLAAQARAPGALRRAGRAARAVLHGARQRHDRRRRARERRRCTTGSTSTSTATAPTCGGGWCRRRRRRRRQRLTNVAFWPVVPEVANPRHRSGPLSAVFLALSVGPLGRRLIAEPIRLKHVGPPPYRPAGAPRERRCATCRGPSASRRLPLEEPGGEAAAAGVLPAEPRPALRARVPRRAAAATRRAG